MATTEARRPSLQAERPSRPSLHLDTRARPSLQIDTRPSFQLFPPPPRPPPPALSRSPIRRENTVNFSRKPTVTRSVTPQPAAAPVQKPGNDFHELIIRVDSPNSMSTTITAPARAPVPLPQQSTAAPSVKVPQSASSGRVSAADSGYSSPPGANETHISPVSPPINRAVSPQHVAQQQAVRNFSPAPTDEHRRLVSPPPADNSRLGPSPNPDSKRTVSPAFSNYRATSPENGLLLSNATSIAAPPPPMRSMFPQYDFTKPLGQQQYRPTGVVPESIPMQVFSRAPYSPDSIMGFSSAAREPYFTPAAHLGSLWEAANGGMQKTSPQLFTLQMQSNNKAKRSSKTSKSPKSALKSQRKQSQISFGPSENHGFYTISMEEHSRTDETFLDPCEDAEIFVLRNHPTEPASLPVAHITIKPPPHLSTITRHHLSMPSPAYHRGMSSPTPSHMHSPTFSPRPSTSASALQEAIYHVTTIFSKLAALSALEEAASSPEAVRIAQVDPNATSPAAAQLAEHAVREAETRESCDLLWVATAASGRYHLRHPMLGNFPVRVEGLVGKRFNPADMANSPLIGNAAQARVSIYTPEELLQQPGQFGTPLQRQAEALASLDLVTGALAIDAAVIQSLGNHFLIDTLCTTLFAVAAAESRRGADPAMRFAAPPVAPLSGIASPKSKGKAPSTKKLRAKAREVMNDTPAQYDLEAATRDRELPKATRSLLSLLGLGVKLAFWVLQFGVKILVRIIVGLSDRYVKNPK